MQRDDFIRALRRYARKRDITFEVDVQKGKGSHYVVYLGGKAVTVPANLYPIMIRGILKHLSVDPDDL